jgi:spermidine synthase
MTLDLSESDARARCDFSASFRLLPLLLLFAGSGCAALIYEIVWLQLLQLVIGSSAVSLAILLGTYMGGMCLGSLLLPKALAPSRNPLRIYALLETGIGVAGIVVLFAVPWAGRFYAINAGQGLAGILLRGAVAGACLLPPTVLMGATLPVAGRWVEASPKGISWLGLLYGANIAGAVAGCLFAGFYLLRVHDMATATCVAASMNGLVALLGLSLASKPGFKPATQNPPCAKAAPGSAMVYVAIGLSGFCALGAEVIWTRLLSLLLGATVYTFSIILAVFLVGLGIGSGVGSLVVRRTRTPRIALGCCQALVMAGVAWTAWMLARSLPYWPVNPSLSRSPWFNFQLDLVRCFWAILPATVLWGASFPLALAAGASPGRDPAGIVGRIYAANTLGAIFGALGTSLLFIPRLGTQHAQQVLIGCSAVAAILMLALRIQPSFHGFDGAARDPGRGVPGEIPQGRLGAAVWLAAIAGVAVVLAWFVPAIPWQLVAHGRYLTTFNDDRKLLYVGEGMNASVAVTEMRDGVRNFHISGKVEASTDPRDMRMQRMLGHLPALLHPNPRSVLVVGCGAGVTAGCFVNYPEVERIVICEIEPLIPKAVSPYFQKENYNVLKDPRVRIVYDDARHYVCTTREKFDIITSDPIHPWVKGAATLYTKEYFEFCKQHLNPGGLVTQWIPLYESDSGVVRSELATFFDVFPDGTLWSNDDNGQGYDMVVLGGARAMRIDVRALQARLDGNDAAAQSLRDVGFKSAIGLLAAYAGQGRDLGPWLKSAAINRDRNLRLQYLAGLAANRYDEGAIYDDLLFSRRFPDNLFAGSADSTAALRQLLKAPQGKQSTPRH